jgi:predicted TIM-barrel fold metal-dependent hydrolase
MNTTQSDVKEYGHFADNKWRKADGNKTFDVHEPYSGKLFGRAAMFRRIFWDTALAVSDPVLRMLRDVAGLDQVLFGTDFPYLRRDMAVNMKLRIAKSPELNDAERAAILGGNAVRLFPGRSPNWRKVT